MGQTNRYIEELIEKFFEGLTSIQEEKELYKYFSEERELPENLKQYKTLFQYFETELEDELLQTFELKNDVMADTLEQSKPNTLLNKKWIFVVSAVAASLLLLFVVKSFDNAVDFNIYEGSYVKRDGVVIYDETEIEAERLRLEAFVEEKLTFLNQPFEETEYLEIDVGVENRLINLRKPFVEAQLQIEEMERIEKLGLQISSEK